MGEGYATSPTRYYGSLLYWQEARPTPPTEWGRVLPRPAGRVTDLGFVMAIVLMALFTMINFLAVSGSRG